MYDEIYLEVDEEVTSVIDKIKKSKQKAVILTLPRNAVLGQSIVNLKLVYKEATAAGKEVAMVTTDKVTRSLAERIGFQVYDSTKSVTIHSHNETDNKNKEKKDEIKIPSSPKIVPIKAEEDKEELPIKEDASPELASAGFISQPVESVKDDEKTLPMKEEELAFSSQNDKNKDVPAAPVSELHASTYTANNIKTESTRSIPTSGNLRFFRQPKRRLHWWPVLFLLGILLIGTGASAFYLPTAKVTLTVKAEPFEETVKSNVDTEATQVDIDKAVIPGKVISIQQTTKSSAKATGKKDLGTKATGAITLFNGWDSQVHTYTAGTHLRDAKTKNEYLLDQATTVPGATSSIVGGKATITPGQINTTVTAFEAGEAYNILPTRLNLPSLSAAQQDLIYATAATTFSGGTSKVVTVIKDGDINTLTDNVRNQNKDEGIAELKKEAGDAVVVDKAIQTVSQDVTSSGQSGDEADTVEVTVKGAFSVISFTKDDQQKLLDKLLTSKIPDGQQLVTQDEGVAPDISNYDLNLVSEKRLELTNNLKAFTVKKFNPENIKHSITAAKPDAVKALVQGIVPVTDAQVEISPAWWKRMPFLASKITVNFVYKNQDTQ